MKWFWKLYNVFSLKVVKVSGYDGVNFVICESTSTPNVYKDVILGNIITVENEEDVELLKDYYALIEIIDFETREPLMLSKDDIFKKCISININYYLQKQEKKEQKNESDGVQRELTKQLPNKNLSDKINM